MKRGLILAGLLLLCAALQAASVPGNSQVVQQIGKMPLAFTKNMGQWDDRVLFRANAGGATMWFTKEGVTYQFTRRIDTRSGAVSAPGVGQNRFGFDATGLGAGTPQLAVGDDHFGNARDSIETLVLTAKFVGANANPEVIAEGQMEYKCNYFLGNEPMKWRTDVPNYEAITVKGIYPGIDLKYSSDGSGQAAYEFVVAPEADIAQIKVTYEGAEETSLDATGRMIVRTKWGDMIAAVKSPTNGVLSGTTSFSQLSEKTIGFEAADASRQALGTLTVSLVYSTYLGGGDTDHGYGIAVDGSGYAYVTGETRSSNFPKLNPYQRHQWDYDVFVTKFSSTGSSLIYSTYLGGGPTAGGADGVDCGYGIAVDGSGNPYVTGGTTSPNFPTLNPFQGTLQGSSDAFVTKLSITGNSLIYSTYLGGEQYEEGYGIAVDGSGNAYVTGWTGSPNFPTLNPYQTGGGVFVTKFSSSGTMIYSTCLNGGFGCGIAVDGSGYAYVTGYTESSNFPTQNPYQTYQGSSDVFVTKLSSSGNSLIYSTYLGGAGGEWGHAIAVDGSSNAYVTGLTTSTNFPTVNPFQTYQGWDVFVTKLSSSGDSLIYSTYLGGGNSECGFGIAVDGSGNAYVTGYTRGGFPTLNPYQTDPGNGRYDAFVSKFSSTGNSLIYSTYLGGGADEFAYGIAVDGSGNAYVTGYTDSPNFPTLNPYQTYQGGQDVFVTKLRAFQERTTLDVQDLTLTPNPPTGGETATISFNIKNVGNSTWQSRPLLLNIYVVDWKCQGPDDGFWLRLHNESAQVREEKHILLSTIPSLSADASHAVTIPYTFRAPDYSDELRVEICAATKGQLIDSENGFIERNIPSLSVNFNTSTYINCFGEILTGITGGLASGSTIKTVACWVGVGKDVIWDYNLIGLFDPEVESIQDRMSDPQTDAAEYVELGTKTIKQTLTTADRIAKVIDQGTPCVGQGGSAAFSSFAFIFSLIEAGFDEFTGNGCGAVLIHTGVKVNNYLLGLSKELSGAAFLGTRFLTFLVGCPAELEVISASGDTAYIAIDGTVKNSIDSCFAFPAGDSTRIVLVPNTESYKMNVYGVANGDASITIIQPKPNGSAEVIYFSIPITATTVASTTIDSLSTTYQLQIDSNGDGVFESSTPPDSTESIHRRSCGDADGEGTINIADAVYLISYIFSGGPAPDPLAAGDTDCDGSINIADAVYLIGYIFSHGPQPCAGCK